MGAGIGISGVHRTGKSTLMNELAQVGGVLPTPTKVGDVFRDLGLGASEHLSPSDRMTVQEEILRRQRAIYTEARSMGGFITDRTPLDLITYTLAEIGPSSVSDPVMHERLLKYVQDCYDLTNEFFSFVVLVQPGIPVVEEAFKGSNCPVYVEHFNMLICGAALDARCKVQRLIMPRSMTKIEDRVRHCIATMEEQASLFNKRMSAVHTFH